MNPQEEGVTTLPPETPLPSPSDRPTVRATPRFTSPSPSRSRSPRGSSRSTTSPRPSSRSRQRTQELLEAERQALAEQAARDGVDSSGVAPAAATDQTDEGLPPLRDAVQQLAEAGARGAAKKRNATEQDWAEFLGTLFGFLSMLLVWFLVAGRGFTKTQRRNYEFTDEEADAIGTPAARILARSWVNDRWGKHILGASDYILLALVLTEYTERIAPLVKERVRTLPRPQRRAQTTRQGETRPARATAPAPPTTQETDNGVVERPVQQDWQPFVAPSQLT